MSKVFEHIVFNFMYDYLVSSGLLNEHICGLRKNESTINRLIGLLDEKDVILILLNISKAFDKSMVSRIAI